MCDYCEKSISVDAGDAVQGDRWYHDSCLRGIEGKDSKRSLDQFVPQSRVNHPSMGRKSERIEGRNDGGLR